MKSIMEEASSILKAIEKAWASAGKPKEFTIKVYEEPEKNFIGMTTRPAKIGIFFSEAPSEAPKQRRPRQNEEPAKRQERTRAPKQQTRRPESEMPTGPVWTPEMIESAKESVTTIINLMDLDKGKMSVTPEHFHLRIQFDRPIFDDKNREKHLFASLSHLVLTMLKRQYKRPLKGYKIILLGP